MSLSWADEYDSDMEQENLDTSPSIKKVIDKVVINKVVIDKVVIDKVNISDKQFPLKFSKLIQTYKSPINYTLFEIVNNSEYSCLMPWYIHQVNYFINKVYNYTIYKIVDTGANIGVDCINFLYNFPNSKLIAFEIEKQTYDVLCKNLISFNYFTKTHNISNLLNINNKVQAYNSDFLLNMNLTQDADIVFIDAPWGGKIYKDKKNVSVYLQPEDNYYNINCFDENKNIINITKKLLSDNYNVKSVILKVPYNYEFDNLKHNLSSKNTSIIFRNIYKGKSNYIAFVLIFIIKK